MLLGCFIILDLGCYLGANSFNVPTAYNYIIENPTDYIDYIKKSMFIQVLVVG